MEALIMVKSIYNILSLFCVDTEASISSGNEKDMSSVCWSRVVSMMIQ